MGRYVVFFGVAAAGFATLVALWVIVFPVLGFGGTASPAIFVFVATMSVGILIALAIATVGIVRAILKTTNYGKSNSDLEHQRRHDHRRTRACRP